jgi:hypothetical protein
MNNGLIYYYNLKVKEIYPKNNDYLIFTNDDDEFILKRFNKDLININEVIQLVKSYNIERSNYYSLVNNKFNNAISQIDEKDYVLLKAKGLLGDYIDVKAIYNNLYISRGIEQKYSNNWSLLWQKRVDYIEYQVGQLGKNKKEVINSFGFFSGLAENAISFISINKIDFKKCKVSLCHRRINYPNMAINYYNILNIKADYEVRDMAEYIKSKIMIDENIDNDINYIINKCDYNVDDLKLFMARLMFPSQYFDLIEEVIVSDTTESLVEKYVEKIDSYLHMLSDVYLEISKKNTLIIPEWLKTQN